MDKDLLQKAVSELETDVNYMQEQKEYKRQRKVRASKIIPDPVETIKNKIIQRADKYKENSDSKNANRKDTLPQDNNL